MRRLLSSLVILGLALPTAAVAAPPPKVVQLPEASGRVHAQAARILPNFDLESEARSGHRIPAATQASALGAPADLRTGAPSFVWGRRQDAKALQSLRRMPPSMAALAQLPQVTEALGVASLADLGVNVGSVNTNELGQTVVTLAQEVGGIEVFRGSLKLLLDRDQQLVAASGRLSPAVGSVQGLRTKDFVLGAADAVARAYTDVTGQAIDTGLLSSAGPGEGAYSRFDTSALLPPEVPFLSEPARAKRVLYPLGASLVPGWYVEVNVGTQGVDTLSYAYVLSARDGKLLMRNNLVQDADLTFRAWVEPSSPFTPQDGPTGNAASPYPLAAFDQNAPYVPYAPTNLVTIPRAPNARADVWLPEGATQTIGNNVRAYADLGGGDGFQSASDVMGAVSGPDTFDYTYDLALQPYANATQRQAAIAQLFFTNNWLHDFYYPAGFDEASGNAQLSNYGRGGLEGDSIRAEAQDSSGSNNANMSTPADGASPRMQMYVFRNVVAGLFVSAPANLAGQFTVNGTTIGPQDFNVTTDIVRGIPASGCQSLQNAAAVAGKIALISWVTPGCTVVDQLLNAHDANAAGILVSYNAAGQTTAVPFVTGSIAGFVKPVLIVSANTGAAFDGAFAASQTVTAQMVRLPEVDLDGSIDNAIVAHEWGHYISNRLIGNGAGLGTNQGRSLGEGWGDFTALMMMVRAEDASHPANVNWTGAYAAASYAMRGDLGEWADYFGIRRMPYSVDRSKNSLTFGHIADSAILPDTAVYLNYGINNAEVHMSGEVWTAMLWEAYVSLLRAHPFNEAQTRMKNYLVTAYKLTPVFPTFTEARDAVLAAALASDVADFERMGAAFASRGAGVGAVSPDRFSTDHEGVVESYASGGEPTYVTAWLSDNTSPTAFCDNDGVLDDGETGSISVRIANTGWRTLSATTVTVASTTPGLQILQPSITLPTLSALADTVVSLPVRLQGAAGPVTPLSFTITVHDPEQNDPAPETASFKAYGNLDVTLGSSRTETVDVAPGQLPWSYTAAVGEATFAPVTFNQPNQAFWAPNHGALADYALESPALVVGTGAFTVSFKHAWTFEADASANYDGAVVELSSDGGATWTDVGSAFTAGGYNGAISNCCSNPLQTRSGFVNSSPGFPALQTSTLSFGTTYAGQTVKLRFRIGTDPAAGAEGWYIDDIAVGGITNTPFASLQPDDAVCPNRPPVANAGADLAVDERTAVSIVGTATDADGVTGLVYTWTQVSGPTALTAPFTGVTLAFTAPDVAANATATFKLTVSDGSVSSEDTVAVLIRHVNRLPVVSAGVDAAIDERTTATLLGTATDADTEQTLTYSWTQVGGPNVTLSSATALQPTFAVPEVTANTTATFRLTVGDGTASVSDEVVLTFRHVNRAPVAAAGPDAVVDERTVATLAGSGTDADTEQTLTYAWTQVGGPNVALSSTTVAAPTFTVPEVTANVDATFRLTVGDGTATATDDVVLTFRQVNRLPVASAGPDAAVDERTVATLLGSVQDADTEQTHTFAWTQVNGPTVVLSSATAAQPTFTVPEVTADSLATFSLTVNDGADSATDVVVLNFRHVNRLPVVSAGTDAVIDERTVATLQGVASDEDTEQTLAFTWAQVSGPTVVLSSASVAQPTFTVPEVTADTAATFSLTVSDGTATATDTVTLSFRHVNLAPTAAVELAEYTAFERDAVTVTGAGTDPDQGDVVTFAWTQLSGDEVVLTGADTGAVSFTAPDTARVDETVVLQLVVSDGQLASEPVTVTINVLESNRRPLLTLMGESSIEVDERTELSLQVSASDDDLEDGVTITWSQVSGPEVLLTGTGAETLVLTTPEIREVASADVVLQAVANDGLDDSEPVLVTLTVKDVPLAPTVSILDREPVQSGSSVTLATSASDPENGTLTYAWTQTAGPNVELDTATAGQAAFVAPAVEADTEFTFQVTVTSSAYGLTASDSVTLTVTPEDVDEPAGCGCSSASPGSMLPFALGLLALLFRRKRATV